MSGSVVGVVVARVEAPPDALAEGVEAQRCLQQCAPRVGVDHGLGEQGVEDELADGLAAEQEGFARRRL